MTFKTKDGEELKAIEHTMNDKVQKEAGQWQMEVSEDRRTLFNDAGEWSRHYSNVRMTVATFVITSCVAIIALTTDHGGISPQVGNAVGLLWVLGLFIFYAFTHLTFKERNRQLRHRKGLSVTTDSCGNQEKKGARIRRDAASYALLSLNTVFIWIVCHSALPMTSLANSILMRIMVAISILSLLFILFADSWIGKRGN